MAIQDALECLARDARIVRSYCSGLGLHRLAPGFREALKPSRKVPAPPRLFPDFPSEGDIRSHHVPIRSSGNSLPVQLLLFGLTIITTTTVGGCHYVSFITDMSTLTPPRQEAPTPFWGLVFDSALWQEAAALLSDHSFLLPGLWYSLTILAILGCHEMGHYLACVRYGVDATRPYFLPAPLPLTGTLGAFIRIRSRIPNRTALFDIAIAGPIAGFFVAVIALFFGLWMSRIDRLPTDSSFMTELGEPLMFRFAAWVMFGDVAREYSINMHPVAFAAWFGLLATALNLFPFGQLDGGHISYAILGRRSTVVTLLMVGVAITLTFMSSGWIAWAVLMVIMIAVLGPHHPATFDAETGVDKKRLFLAFVALVILIVCFTPTPIDVSVDN